MTIISVPRSIVETLSSINTYIYCPDVITAMTVSNVQYDDFRVKEDWYKSIGSPLTDQNVVDQIKRNIGQQIIPVVWENSRHIIRNADIAYNANNKVYVNLIGNIETFTDAINELHTQGGYILLMMIPIEVRKQLY